jgi:endoribonuclease Dicer
VLAKQQAKYFNDTTPLITKHYTGDLNVDAWKQEKWREEFQEAQVRRKKEKKN